MVSSVGVCTRLLLSGICWETLAREPPYPAPLGFQMFKLCLAEAGRCGGPHQPPSSANVVPFNDSQDRTPVAVSPVVMGNCVCPSRDRVPCVP